MLVQNPSVQIFLARVASQHLTEELKTNVQVEELTINAKLEILLKNVRIHDAHQNPMLSADLININIDRISLKNKLFHVDKASLVNGEIDLLMYKGEEVMNYQFMIDSLISPSQSVDTAASELWDFKVDAIHLESSDFSFKNENKYYLEYGIDYDWMDVEDIDLKMNGLRVNEDTVFVNVEQLNFIDRSGFSIEEFSGNFFVSTTCLDVQNLLVTTMNSRLDLDFHFEFDELASFNNFEENIHIKTSIRNTKLDLADIGFFAPIMWYMTDVFEITAEIEGTVSYFRADYLNFTFGEITEFEGEVAMKGLPTIETTLSEISIKKLITSAEDISSFRLPFYEYNSLYMPDELKRWGQVSIIGSAKGVYNNFNAKVALQSEIGNLVSNITMTNDLDDSVRYEGRVQALHFNIGKMFNAYKHVGEMNMDANFKGSGLKQENVLLEIDGIVDSLDFRGNNYNQIRIDGTFAESKFNGHLNVNDEDMGFNFNGIVDFSEEVPKYYFSSDIAEANLFNINLFRDDASGILSTKMDIDFEGANLDDMEGVIKIDSVKYLHNDILYTLDSIRLIASENEDGSKLIKLQSNMIDADIQGDFLFKELIASVKRKVADYLPVLKADSSSFTDSLATQTIDFKVDFKRTQDLSSIFVPDLSISNNSQLSGFYNSTDQEIYVEVNADMLNYQGIRFYDFFLKTNNDEDAFLVHLGSKDMIFKESTETDTVALGLENLNLLATLQNDSIDYRLRWDDVEAANSNKGYLSGYMKFQSLDNSFLKIEQADVIVNDSIWQFTDNGIVEIDSTHVRIKDIGIFTDSQSLTVNGNIGYVDTDTINLNFKDWNFSNFDILINNPNMDIDGIINGNLKLANLYRAPNMDANLLVSDLVFNNEPLGYASINTQWDKTTESLFTEVDVVDGDKKLVELIGYYYPTRTINSLDANILFTDFKLKTVTPFVSYFISGLEGTTTGNFLLSGTLEEPVLLGDLEMQNAIALIDYLNVKYEIKNRVNFVENAILFDEVVVQDSLGRSAQAAGEIIHDYFNDLYFNINLYPENINCLNTNEFQNKLFYGRANVSGDVRIHGPVDQLILDANLVSEEDSKIFLPIDYDLEMMDTHYIVFVNNKDTTSKNVESYNVDLSGITVNLNLSINDNAEVELFLPYQMGRIEADGSGELSLNVNSRGDFSMNGDYNINSGDFYFSLQRIVNRRFSILEGSKISWTGDPYEADLDVRALYTTKASLADIGIENERRVNVDCYLGLKESLSDPRFKFGISLPNVDRDIEQEAFAIIDTTNEAQMNQQMIYLLVMNSFATDQLFGNYSVAESSLRLLSGQVSNLLSQISKDFDIGINYRPGDDISREEFEVALSTQLFDNRLTIDGNFGMIGLQGNAASTANQQATDIVGDVNIEYKLTDDGRFRIRAFNRSNVSADVTQNVYDDIAPNTQGIGIFYRKDFDSFEQLFLGKEYEKKPEKKKKEEKKEKSDEKESESDN